TFTIPLMKRVGYRPEFAAAVEAAATTGGAYMPPVRGAGAFLLAQFTDTSYFDVVKIAAIPAILYYLSVGYIVYLRAYRRGLHGVPASELPPWPGILRRLHLLLPIPIMVYYLVIGDSPFLAAFKTIALILLLKASDLLAEIRTPWSGRLWRPFLGVSIGFGALAYFAGFRIGAPFTWFADELRGLNLGDAVFWVVASHIVLKLGEITAAGARTPAAGASAAGSGPGVYPRLGGALADLVKAAWSSLEAGARNTLVVCCIAGVLGVLLSSATQSDLPGRVSNLLIEFSFGLLPLTIFWIIVAGYIVGMGLPATASYVVLVIFGVLSLTNLGVPTLTAHLICFWMAVISAVTPPVALAAYAASAIAMSDPVKTGFQAVKLASWVFLMPFLFVYTPLLLDGTALDITITVAACLAGIVTWGGVVEGFFIRHTTPAERGMLAVASVFLLLPVDHLITWLTPAEWVFHHYPFYAAGAALLAAVFLMQRARPAERIEAVAGAPQAAS
ncbi:MAG: TRAP transporter fused permease subunit, partial [Candidatus Tectomicrobia bacterium]|nr:TRAP transporter fused permease subunit [Candidatus Tectomicrobia bacterium]